MRSRKLFTKKKAKNGEGRQANNKHILLPEEVVEELKLYKLAYQECLRPEKDKNGNPIPVKVSWEQMFRRWMNNVGRFDKDVKEKVEEWKHSRKEFSRETMQTTRKAVGELATRAEENGSSIKEEALKEQDMAKAELEESRKVPFISLDSPISSELSAMAGTMSIPSEDVRFEDSRLQAACGVKTEKRFIHPDGRSYKAIPGNFTPFYAKKDGINVGQARMFEQGFEIKDVEISD